MIVFMCLIYIALYYSVVLLLYYSIALYEMLTRYIYGFEPFKYHFDWWLIDWQIDWTWNSCQLVPLEQLDDWLTDRLIELETAVSWCP